ncbi:hypothetical protein L1785_09790 [Antribacter sp. KLBMP9083]|uniref:Uncharacterized protein n=1 Tax=Antribacter soli TaxID=2910976 RepID=A0AA41U6Q1_9MICO|nr:hypothetical protein [Antribacter soli]MCF4121273.1 hypothetical protein [Antribacter soli]
MSVAACLGIENEDVPTMRRAAVRWPVWRSQESDLPAVEGLDGLRAWMDCASPEDQDLCLATLVRIGMRDQTAVMVVCWLLLPGAVRRAAGLRDVSADVDAVFAGELWLAVREFDWRRPRKVAAAILSTARRAAMADLGIGEPARRRDRTWAATVPVEALPEPPHLPTRNDALAAAAELREVLDDAQAGGVIDHDERRLLTDLGLTANLLDAPARRGRGGLTTPAVADVVAARRRCSARTVRRQASETIDRIAEHARRDSTA